MGGVGFAHQFTSKIRGLVTSEYLIGGPAGTRTASGALQRMQGIPACDDSGSGGIHDYLVEFPGFGKWLQICILRELKSLKNSRLAESTGQSLTRK